MTTFADNYYVDRYQTDSLKWDGVEERFGDKELLPLWVADMDFQVPKEVQEKMQERINHGVFGYSLVPDEYVNSVISWQKRRHNVLIQKEWLRFCTGVVNALHYLIQGFTKEEEAVMIFSPVYYPFYDVVNENNRQLVVSDLMIEKGQYSIDFNDMEEKIKHHHVKALIFCSPHNPVGRVWTVEEMEKVALICQKYHVLLISDEIHQDFIHKNHVFTSFLGIEKVDLDQLIVLNSASKSFNLASLLHSHVLIPSDEMRATYDEFITTKISNPTSLMGVIATQASYEFGEKWLDELNQTIDDNFDLMTQTFKALLPEAIVYEKQGTYLSWVDLSYYVTQDKMKEIVQDKAKLAIDYGEWFGKQSGTFIRINLATHPNNIKLAVQHLEKAIKNS
ncbi:MalY/PatB family protein [Vagococcus bubulae]|nr:MalY/PatB family protein [Vagococcus bubulae]